MTPTDKGTSKLLADAPEGSEFYLTDGRRLRNIRELLGALSDMSDATFESHVNESKNDLAYWVRDVYGDTRLVNALFRSSSRLQAAASVARRLETATG